MVIINKPIKELTELEATPIPTLESAFQYLGKAKWSFLLDLNQEYLQIPLNEKYRKFTSFVFPFQQFEYNYLHFRLASGGLALTCLIEKIFGDIKYNIAIKLFLWNLHLFVWVFY